MHNPNITRCPVTKAMLFTPPKHVSELRELENKVQKLEEDNAKLKELLLLMASCMPKEGKGDERYKAIQDLSKELQGV